MTLFIAALVGSAHAFDHTHAGFAAVLDGAVSTGGVDYDLITTRKDKLDGYLKAVADANVSGFSNDQKLAFYVNAYNAHTVNLIVTHKQPASIKDLMGGKVWDQATFDVGRQRLTLNAMEHENARKLADGRVHAVINCASVGCPPLPPKPLVGEKMDAQLDEAAKRWVKTNAYTIDGDTARVSLIFKWYSSDFTGKPEGSLSEEEQQKAGVAFIKKHGGDLGATTKTGWAEYDWSLNKKK